MPEIEELENPVNKYASQVISSDGKLIGTWSYSRANRIFVAYDDISPSVIQALIATEDERFYSHSGIDIKALFRILIFLALSSDPIILIADNFASPRTFETSK